jgi:hypothetical protein
MKIGYNQSNLEIAIPLILFGLLCLFISKLLDKNK